jgi:hypothetical protein
VNNPSQFVSEIMYNVIIIIGFVRKSLFGLFLRDLVFEPILQDIPFVPIETIAASGFTTLL